MSDDFFLQKLVLVVAFIVAIVKLVIYILSVVPVWQLAVV